MRNWISKPKYKMNDGDEESNNSQLPPIYINTANSQDQQPQMPGIAVVGNRIQFYSDIYDESALMLNKVLLELDIQLQNTKNALGDDTVNPIIHLHLNTGGGSIYAAFAIIDTIRNLKASVYTYVEGYCASAGTLISSIGKKRYIGTYSQMLIHQLSGDMYGKFSEMEDQMFNSTALMKTLKAYYKKHTKLPMKTLDELLSKDISLTAEQCLQYGLVDEIR